MSPNDVTANEARRAGFSGLEEFRRWLDSMKPGHLFQRIEVRYVAEDKSLTSDS
jgi:hypothetical protein